MAKWGEKIREEGETISASFSLWLTAYHNVSQMA
jgi:hypothetical protein